MEELEALNRLQSKEERALLWFIERYSAYVTAIFRRMLGASATPADLEELASDVFFIFCNKAAAIEAEKVKAYLGSVARNKARDFLRRGGKTLPLEEDVLLIAPQTPQQTLEARELAACLRAALDAGTFEDFLLGNGHMVLLHPAGADGYALQAGDIVTLSLEADEPCYLSFGLFRDGRFVQAETVRAAEHRHTFEISEDGIYCFTIEYLSVGVDELTHGLLEVS